MWGWEKKGEVNLFKMAEVSNGLGGASEDDDVFALHDEIAGAAQPFLANNKDELVAALREITESIKAAIFFGSAPAPTSFQFGWAASPKRWALSTETPGRIRRNTHVPLERVQPDLLAAADRQRSARLMKALDAINTTMGKDTLVPAAMMGQTWHMQQNHRSPSYTTRLADVPVAQA